MKRSDRATPPAGRCYATRRGTGVAGTHLRRCALWDGWLCADWISRRLRWRTQSKGGFKYLRLLMDFVSLAVAARRQQRPPVVALARVGRHVRLLELLLQREERGPGEVCRGICPFCQESGARQQRPLSTRLGPHRSAREVLALRKATCRLGALGRTTGLRRPESRILQPRQQNHRKLLRVKFEHLASAERPCCLSPESRMRRRSSGGVGRLEHLAHRQPRWPWLAPQQRIAQGTQLQY